MLRMKLSGVSITFYLLSTCFMTLLAKPAVANPVTILGPLGAIELTSLFLEALFIVFAVSFFRLPLMRFFYTWMPLTYITYLLFIAYLMSSVLTYEYFAGDLHSSITEFQENFGLISGEILIVILEAWLLGKLIKREFFNPLKVNVSVFQRFLISLGGNLVSFLASLHLYSLGDSRIMAGVGKILGLFTGLVLIRILWMRFGAKPEKEEYTLSLLRHEGGNA